MFDSIEKGSLEVLFRQVAHLHFKRLHVYLEKIGLYKGQPRLLWLLWEKDGRTQKEIAKKLDITPATVTKMVQRMENKGFIVRKSDTEDMRVSRIYVTDYGFEIKNQIEEIEKDIEEEFLKGFTLEERILLRRFLIHMKDNLLQSFEEK